MISKITIDKVFQTALVEEVIGDFIQLKKSGSNYKGLSPFTNEKTPSFMVSPTKQIWKDFSSGKGGNVVAFLMEHEGFSYPEALKYLGKKYNIPTIGISGSLGKGFEKLDEFGILSKTTLINKISSLEENIDNAKELLKIASIEQLKAIKIGMNL